MRLKTKVKNFSIDASISLYKEKQSVGPFSYEESGENIATTQEDEHNTTRMTVHAPNLIKVKGFIIKREPEIFKPVKLLRK